MICQKCNHNHNDNQRPWCDRSDLEIKYQTLCEAAEKLAEALEDIDPQLQELAEKLKEFNPDKEKGIAEHDACLIAIGFLNTKKALTEYRSKFAKEEK